MNCIRENWSILIRRRERTLHSQSRPDINNGWRRGQSAAQVTINHTPRDNSPHLLHVYVHLHYIEVHTLWVNIYLYIQIESWRVCLFVSLCPLFILQTNRTTNNKFALMASRSRLSSESQTDSSLLIKL